jgi:hypothetical protein
MKRRRNSSENTTTTENHKRFRTADEDKSQLLLILPIELFEKILSYLSQSFIIHTFSQVCSLFNQVAKAELIWKKRVFSITKHDKSVKLDYIANSSHIQISNPKFHWFSYLYKTKSLMHLELANTRLSISQFAFVTLSNPQLQTLAFSNLEVSPVEDSFGILCSKFKNLCHCTSLKWNHVHFSNVQVSNTILKHMLDKCPNLETLHFATQNCANLDTAKIIFNKNMLRNLSLFGIDEISLDEFFAVACDRQWNSLNLQSCRRICNRELLAALYRSKSTESLRELTIRFEPSLERVTTLEMQNVDTEHLSLSNLTFLRLQNIDPTMASLVTSMLCIFLSDIVNINISLYRYCSTMFQNNSDTVTTCGE